MPDREVSVTVFKKDFTFQAFFFFSSEPSTKKPDPNPEQPLLPLLAENPALEIKTRKRGINHGKAFVSSLNSQAQSDRGKAPRSPGCKSQRWRSLGVGGGQALKAPCQNGLNLPQPMISPITFPVSTPFF